MNYNKTVILPLCALVALACVVCGAAVAIGRAPAEQVLDIAAANAQTDAADAQATADVARAEADRARAELVTAQSYADALDALIGTVRGEIIWFSLSSTFAPLLYIGGGICVGAVGAFFAGAWWGSERERNARTPRAVLVHRAHDDAGGAS